MIQIDEELWVHEDSMTLGVTTLRLRMTVVRLGDGGLWVHSPTALTPGLREQVESIGPVTCLVAASNGHNTWLREWREAFPDAALYVSGGIPGKLRLKAYHRLDADWVNIWQHEFAHLFMTGVPFFDETLFLHKSSRSLILTDFIQNHSDPRPSGLAGMLARFVLEPIGFKDICIAPPLRLGLTIKDKPGFKLFINKLMEWEFDRIIVTHGDIIEPDAKPILLQLCERFC